MRSVSSPKRHVLRPQGQPALSTIGPALYAELRQAFAGIDRHRHTLDFSEPTPRRGRLKRRLHRPAGDASLDHAALSGPEGLLGAVKAIGANALGAGRRSGMMGRPGGR